MEQYEKGFQRFHAGEDVRPVTSCKFLLASETPHAAKTAHSVCQKRCCSFSGRYALTLTALLF